MALIACPECKQQISDAALACPHCGYPMQPAATEATPAEAVEIVNEFSTEINEALKKAGLSGLNINAGQFGKPTVTTRVFTSSSTSPAFTTVTPANTSAPTTVRLTSWTGSGYSYNSRANLFGFPLLSMSQGYDPATGRKRVARGVIAIGDVAVGGLAIGGAAFGVVALGGVSVGVFAMGGLAIGLLLAFGGMAVGYVAFGGIAVGVYALGGLALGLGSLTP